MNNQSLAQRQETYRYSPEELLNLVCEHSPVIKRTIEQYGNHSIAEYLDEAIQTTNESYQPRDDLLDVVYRYAASLLGEEVAEHACADLKESPSVLTTNHHGVDFFAQSVQGNLIFSQRKINGNPARTVPIFACGNVPLNSLTYPAGALIYDNHNSGSHTAPTRFPIFPNRLRQSTVSTTQSFDEKMLNRAAARLDEMFRNDEISSKLMSVLQEILTREYKSSLVLGLPTFSEQSVVLNSRIWQRLFRSPENKPDMVYLEVETIVGMLLKLDLKNPSSLAWAVMFDPHLRQTIIEALDGQNACWTREKLIRRLWPDLFYGKIPEKPLCGGTFLFWGISNQGRRVPLHLGHYADSGAILHGVDDKGNYHSFKFTPASIIRYLADKSLIPSIFTCALVLSFARGISCVGGYYQAEYLPAIQQGFVMALQKIKRYNFAAKLVAKIPTGNYLAGLQPVFSSLKNGLLAPIGPLEIATNKGLSNKDLEKIRSMSIYDAHIAGISETASDILPRQYIGLN